MARRNQRRSLAEQVAELSTPEPSLFHPDVGNETGAKVCDYEEEEGGSVQLMPSRLRQLNVELDDDHRYAGRAVGRKDLLQPFEGGIALGSAGVWNESDQSDEEQGSVELPGLREEGGDSMSEESGSLDSHHLEPSEDTEVTSLQTGSSIIEKDGQEDEGGFLAVSLRSIEEDVEKGKAASLQIGMWDGLLEGRIRLQKTLVLCNRLPQPDAISEFQQAGGQQLEVALQENQTALRSLLDNLLELQWLLLEKNKETVSVLHDQGEARKDEGESPHDSDEEIPSDKEEGGGGDDIMGCIISNKDDSDQLDEGDDRQEAVKTRRSRKRKRGSSGWVLSTGKRVYEEYVAGVHESLRPYREGTITKWNNKTRLTSGKVTSKAYVQVNRSVIGQIQHVLSNCQRLVKRTQLKRSVYRVLGKQDKRGEREGEGEVPSQNDHLREYDDEIFDDDDFYPQLLRELIERKMNFTETSDPIAMGRQWLELQKLKTKVKKKVDTKASKGRRIRYNIHPKLANFMAPVNKGTMSDVSRNDLFLSVFGGSLTDSAHQ